MPLSALLAPTPIAFLLTGYALGCINGGYYLVRGARGADVRESGSGGTGATNVGRSLGTWGFVVTLLIDAGKGALAVGCAVWAEQPAVVLWGVAVAVVAGHVWPAQLRFRGGRGVATFLGAVGVLDAMLLLLPGVLTLLLLRPLGRFVRAGLVGLCAAPAGALALQRGTEAVVGTVVLAGVLLVGHRQHLRTWLGARVKLQAPVARGPR